MEKDTAYNDNTFKVFPYLISVILVGCISFFFYRVYFFYEFTEYGTLSREFGGTLLAFWTGLRFDAKVMSIISIFLSIFYVLIGLLNFLFTFFKAGKTALDNLRSSCKFNFITIFIFVLINFLSLAQLQFYSFFQTPFTNTIFGFFSDDTSSILFSIWDDYPIIWLSIITIIASYLQYQSVYFLSNFISQKLMLLQKINIFRIKIVLLINSFIFVMMLLLSRGSLGLFPLNLEDSSVTHNQTLNFSIWNPFSAIDYAWSEYKVIKQISLNKESIPEQLERFGYKNMQEVADDLALGHKNMKEDRDSIREMLYTSVPKSSNPTKNKKPPHVVLSIMESWGGYFHQFHNKKDNDLYGSLSKYLNLNNQTDILFSNFFAPKPFTFPTIEYLLLNSYITPLSENLKYGRQRFESSAILPFKKAGYKAIFIYSGDLLWHNVGLILKSQGFDDAYGVADIIKMFPNAPKSPSWNATTDEYLMKFAYEKLDEMDKKGQKVFIVTLSMSNHTPNDTPKGYKPFPLNWNRVKDVAHYPKDHTMKILTTYQYSSHQVGNLLDSIVANKRLADKTIFVATGDHNLRIAFKYSMPRENSHLAQVMGFFHVPQDYLPDYKVNPDIFSGHKDIFPTLYNLALPEGTEYINLGNNLYSHLSEEREFSLGMGFLFSKEGAIMPFLQSDNPAIFKLGKQYFYKWGDVSSRQPKNLEINQNPSKLFIKQMRVQRAQSALRDMYIRQMIEDLDKSAN